MQDNPSVLECFEILFSEEIITAIVNQSNLFYDQRENATPAHKKKWSRIEVNEMYLFISLSLHMAQVKKLKIMDYWTTDKLLATPFFGQVMSRDRYMSILSVLHFCDNNNIDRNDKLFKIRMLLNHVRKAYSDTFYPFQNLCIDESLMLFKGRLSFKQYIPSKRHRFGIKFFVLCDCETGYILDFIIYCGKESDIQEVEQEAGISGNIVLTMMQPYLDSGHTLYTDNWYTSPILYNILHGRQTNACGTVKQNRKYMPDMKDKIEKGEIIHYSTENLLALKWQDKREVRMLSTCNTPEMVPTDKQDRISGEIIYKPKCIIDYNANMGAVDRTDMLQSSIESVRKSIKWYKKVFFHILDMTLLNAHAIYKMKTGENISVADFQLKLVKELVEKYHKNTPRTTSKRGIDGDSPLRLTARHFPSQLPKDTTQKQKYKRCVVCSKQKIRKETSFCCAPCDVPLCVKNCFERYHTVKNY